MSEFMMQPAVYSTGANRNLMSLLELIWIRQATEGNGTFYIISGFGNHNGGVRFFSTFRRHIDNGGRIIAFFGGSATQKMTSKQLVERLLQCGVEVYVVNRKRIFHTKCYGTLDNNNNTLIVTSGNFTAPGISHNVESALHLEPTMTQTLNFRWEDLIDSFNRQGWEIYRPDLADPAGPAWRVLYDERAEAIALEETQEMTMLLTLGHHDTVRINAAPGETRGKGSQYFWLSKDCYDFFPPLTILNGRGYKVTNSCLIKLHYVDLGLVDLDTRVTFEAGNNVDFRLGTGKFRYSRAAQPGDLAALTRISEDRYEIRIFHADTPLFGLLSPYATTFIGHRDKRIGYLSNDRFSSVTGITLPTPRQFDQLYR